MTLNFGLKFISLTTSAKYIRQNICKTSYFSPKFFGFCLNLAVAIVKKKFIRYPFETISSKITSVMELLSKSLADNKEVIRIKFWKDKKVSKNFNVFDFLTPKILDVCNFRQHVWHYCNLMYPHNFIKNFL